MGQQESIDFAHFATRAKATITDGLTDQADVVGLARPRMASVAGSAGSQPREVRMADAPRARQQKRLETSRRIHGRHG
jgi:hypothetical protein